MKTNIIAPGIVTLRKSQYKIPEKNTTPKRYPFINLCFALLFSSAKNSGITETQARNDKLKFGYASIKRSADIIGKIGENAEVEKL